MDVTSTLEMATGDFNTKHCILLFGWLLMTFAIKVSGVRTKKFIEPKFRDVGHNVTVNRGETAVLKCMVDNLGPKKVVWRKEGADYILSVGSMMYAPNEEMSIDSQTFPRDRTQWDLIIKRAQPEHSGTYECQISATKVYTYYVSLTVRDGYHNFTPAIELHGTEYVNKFSQINLTCNATGATRAPDDIDWFHDGQKIYMKDAKWQQRLTITKYQPEIPGRSLISQLLIKRSRISDHGTYICRSSDLDTRSIPVHVLNGPAAEKEIIKREKDIKEKTSRKFVRSCSPTITITWSHTMILVVLNVLFVHR